ncbi:hypothetical protein QOZ80_1BG0051330 [Eleusine coracana subsp. coracana]|nr:hypothetical protein QOZ80_1BG0051330 [Eleusine coracana subsp. coracana]
MASLRRVITDVSPLLVVLLLAASSCSGREFTVVDGADGWITDPAEPQDGFQVTDTLVFLHANVHAVLWVRQGNYAACNTTDPLLRLGDNESRFVLTNIGHYYFISDDAGRCRGGDRVIAFAQHKKKEEEEEEGVTIIITSPAPPPPPKSMARRHHQVASSSAPPNKSPSSPSLGNVASSSPSPPPLLPAAPVPGTTDETISLPSPSIAVTFKACCVLAMPCLLRIVGAAILHSAYYY